MPKNKPHTIYGFIDIPLRGRGDNVKRLIREQQREANKLLIKGCYNQLVHLTKLAYRLGVNLSRRALCFYQTHRPKHLDIHIKVTFTRIILIGLILFNIWPHTSPTKAAPSTPQKPTVSLIKPLHTPKLPKESYVSPIAIPKPPAPAVVSQSYHGTGDYYLDWIVQHESGGNPYAMNPSGACGLFQALPCSKMGCYLSDIGCQIAWGRSYVRSTYGSSYNAYLHWLRFSWY